MPYDALASAWARLRADDARCARWAWAAWCVPLLYISVAIALDLNHFDSWCVYAAAGARWRARQPLYEAGIDGFQYLPHAAMLFDPLARLGPVVSGIVWRSLGWGLFAHAVRRASALVEPARPGAAQLVATVITIGPSLSSLFTGQANLALAALMLLGTVALAERRGWTAALWLAAGLALKPIMIVLILLACVGRLWLVPRLALTVLVALSLPLLFAPAPYVVTEGQLWLVKASVSAQPDRLFEDWRGLAAKLGWMVPQPLLRAARLVAAFGCVGAVSAIRRRVREPDASFCLFAVAGLYLMLFNPRTQPNSYVILIPALGLAAARFVREHRWRAAVTTAAIAASWCGFTALTVLWLRPLTCLVLCALLFVEVRARSRDRRDEARVTFAA